MKALSYFRKTGIISEWMKNEFCMKSKGGMNAHITHFVQIFMKKLRDVHNNIFFSLFFHNHKRDNCLVLGQKWPFNVQFWWKHKISNLYEILLKLDIIFLRNDFVLLVLFGNLKNIGWWYTRVGTLKFCTNHIHGS